MPRGLVVGTHRATPRRGSPKGRVSAPHCWCRAAGRAMTRDSVRRGGRAKQHRSARRATSQLLAKATHLGVELHHLAIDINCVDLVGIGLGEEDARQVLINVLKTVATLEAAAWLTGSRPLHSFQCCSFMRLLRCWNTLRGGARLGSTTRRSSPLSLRSWGEARSRRAAERQEEALRMSAKE